MEIQESTTTKFKSREDIEITISNLEDNYRRIYESLPGLWLTIINSRTNFMSCFNEDYSPKGDFRLSTKVERQLKNNDFSCIFTEATQIYAYPGFLTESDLENIAKGNSIKKVIEGNEVEFRLSITRYSTPAIGLYDTIPVDINPAFVVAAYKKALNDEFDSKQTLLTSYANVIACLKESLNLLPSNTFNK